MRDRDLNQFRVKGRRVKGSKIILKSNSTVKRILKLNTISTKNHNKRGKHADLLRNAETESARTKLRSIRILLLSDNLGSGAGIVLIVSRLEKKNYDLQSFSYCDGF